MPHVENGTIILIGATTENPSFAVNGALLSRSKVVVLDALSADDLALITARAAKKLKTKLNQEVLGLIVKFANGDARKALNILESAVEATGGEGANGKITAALIKDIINKPNLLYDKNGKSIII